MAFYSSFSHATLVLGKSTIAFVFRFSIVGFYYIVLDKWKFYFEQIVIAIHYFKTLVGDPARWNPHTLPLRLMPH